MLLKDYGKILGFQDVIQNTIVTSLLQEPRKISPMKTLSGIMLQRCPQIKKFAVNARFEPSGSDSTQGFTPQQLEQLANLVP